MAVLVEDPAFVSWYIATLRDFPNGMTTMSIAARICGCTRQAVRKATRTGKIRVRSWNRKPGRLHLLPLEDVLTWLCERRRDSERYVEDWDTYLRNMLRLQRRSIVQVGDVLSCEVCGEIAVAVDDVKNKTPQASQ
jgi:hypothetical protein